MKTEEKLIRPKPAGITLKRILVPIDFSALSKKALQYALRFAEEFGADVTLLHVIEPEVPPAFHGFMIAPPVIANGSRARCANRLKELAGSLALRGTGHIQSTVRTGLAAFARHGRRRRCCDVPKHRNPPGKDEPPSCGCSRFSPGKSPTQYRRSTNLSLEHR